MTSRPLRPANISLFPAAQAFVGERLKQVREAHGLTMATLAERIGRSKQAISRYENGTDQPSSDVVSALAEAVGQPYGFFYQPLRPGEENVMTFFRRLKRVTPPELRRASAWRRWLEDLVLFLDDYIELPQLNLPPKLFLPSDADDVDSMVIDSAAGMLREHWGLGNRPIGDLVRTMERNGIVVARFDLGVDDMDAYSFVSSGKAFVALNAYKSNLFRSRFDAAHELAHILFHGSVTANDLADDQIYDRIERQAHRFASALLLPAETFLEDVYSYDPDAMLPLKEKWGASLSAMYYRLLDLDVLSSDEFRRVMANLTRRKWRKREPLDMTSKPENPILFHQALESLLREANFTKKDFLNDLVRGPGVIQRIAALPTTYFEESEELDINLKRHILPITAG